MFGSAAGAHKLPVFPEKDPLDEVVQSSVRLKERMWQRLDRIAQMEGKSRNEVIAFFLEWACDDYDRAKAKAAAEQHPNP